MGRTHEVWTSVQKICSQFSEKRKKGILCSYRFTGLESKRCCWYFGFLIEVLLATNNLSVSTKVKLHTIAFTALQLRDSGSLFSRVEISREQLAELESTCQNYSNANSPLLRSVNPTVWTIGYAPPTTPNSYFKKVDLASALIRCKDEKPVTLNLPLMYKTLVM